MSNPLIAPQVAMAASIADPGADIFRMLLNDRIVVLGSDVNDAVANQIVAQKKSRALSSFNFYSVGKPLKRGCHCLVILRIDC